MPTPTLQTRLLNWYHKNKRILPWRGHSDAYAVWISEIMLQQTRVEAVIPYFGKWMHLFPTVQALAEASGQEVLNVWEGLGYYSRARNLHKAAKIVMKEYGGRLPSEPAELVKLPGIGRYTAGAITSIAFGMNEPALDGNLKRVYARLFDVAEPVDSSKGEKLLWDVAQKNLPGGKAGDFNQALMDLGATICIPKNPRCLICPLMEICKARENGTVDLRPAKKPKKVAPHYMHAAGVIIKKGKVLLAQRPSNGLLGGMWEFPNGRVGGDPARELFKALKLGYSLKVRRKEAMGVIQHAYTHFKVTVHAFRCECSSMTNQQNLEWVSLKKLDDYPMGKVDRQIAGMIRQRKRA
ncbi:MAG TPA: A/G-specific adenine glycosylase [Anaerolineales bacterium]|nr:A/G-specific adenine glycosylase [Anaerolineales bacterium]